MGRNELPYELRIRTPDIIISGVSRKITSGRGMRYLCYFMELKKTTPESAVFHDLKPS